MHKVIQISTQNKTLTKRIQIFHDIKLPMQVKVGLLDIAESLQADDQNISEPLALLSTVREGLEYSLKLCLFLLNHIFHRMAARSILQRILPYSQALRSSN